VALELLDKCEVPPEKQAQKPDPLDKYYPMELSVVKEMFYICAD
jgi:hypothetical protein